MEREVRGGIGMGNTCKPLAVSFQCMTKSTTNKKKKRKNGKNFVANTHISTIDIMQLLFYSTCHMSIYLLIHNFSVAFKNKLQITAVTSAYFTECI